MIKGQLIRTHSMIATNHQNQSGNHKFVSSREHEREERSVTLASTPTIPAQSSVGSTKYVQLLTQSV